MIAKFREQIELFEVNGHYDQAQSARESALIFAMRANDDDLKSVVDFLVYENISLRGFDVAETREFFYTRLHTLVGEKIGPQTSQMAAAKRKLAKVYYILGKTKQAITLADEAWSIFSATLGTNSNGAVESLHALIQWSAGQGDIAVRKLEERVRIAYPICEHLQPLEAWILESGVHVKREVHFHGIVSLFADAWMDLDSIKRRIKPDSSVESVVIDDMRRDFFRGFKCSSHGHSIEGYFDPKPDGIKLT